VLYELPPVPFEFTRDQAVMIIKDLRPPCVAETSRVARGSDDIREQDGGERTIRLSDRPKTCQKLLDPSNASASPR
jgi:hypothetical protein